MRQEVCLPGVNGATARSIADELSALACRGGSGRPDPNPP